MSVLVGKSGEFTDPSGEVFQCIVTGTDDAPYDRMILKINYVRNGELIKGAMLARSSFRPDTTQPEDSSR